MSGTTKLEGILGKDDMTYYDAGRLLGQAAKAISEMPGAFAQATEQAKDDAALLVDSAKSAVRKTKEFYDELEKSERELCRAYDHLYDTVVKKRMEIARKFDDLKPMDVRHVPYNINELLEVAERLSRLSDEQFSRLIELSKSLAN